GTVAEAVFVGFFWNSREREEAVVDERSLVFAQFHFLDSVVEFFAFFLLLDQRKFRLLLVVDVDFGEALAGFYECAENIDIAHLSSCVILSGVTGRDRASSRGVERPCVCVALLVLRGEHKVPRLRTSLASLGLVLRSG